MSEKTEDGRDERRRAFSERYALQLERWAFTRTPTWARGAFDTGTIVREALAEVARTAEQSRCREGILGRIRQTICGRLSTCVQEARGQAPVDGTRTGTPAIGRHLRDAASGAELLEQYEAGLQRLTPVDREAIIGRAELGLSWPEVTELLDKPGVAAARVAVSRALIRLAREMSHERH